MSILLENTICDSFTLSELENCISSVNALIKNVLISELLKTNSSFSFSISLMSDNDIPLPLSIISFINSS